MNDKFGELQGEVRKSADHGERIRALEMRMSAGIGIAMFLSIAIPVALRIWFGA